MKICSNCGNKLANDEKKCVVCKTGTKSAIYVDDNDKERIDEVISSVRAKGHNKPKKKSKLLPIIIVVIVLAIIGSITGGDDDVKETNALESSNQISQNEEEQSKEEKVSLVVTADKMISDLKENALNASNTYKEAYIEVNGKLSNIDSSGKYFTISELNNDFSLDSIMCYIKDEHLETVSKFTKGQEVTVIGTVKSIGEVMGYSLDVEQIK